MNYKISNAPIRVPVLLFLKPLIFEFPLAAFAEVGGYNALLAKYGSALPDNFTSLDPQRYNISPQCYMPRPDAFNLLRDATTGDLPWPGVLFGIAILGGWYWCSDQVKKNGLMIIFVPE